MQSIERDLPRYSVCVDASPHFALRNLRQCVFLEFSLVHKFWIQFVPNLTLVVCCNSSLESLQPKVKHIGVDLVAIQRTKAFPASGIVTF